MKPSSLQLRELHEQSPKNVVDMDSYFTSKNYFAIQRRKKIQLARTLTELEIEDGNRNERIDSI